jgi:hypothetical protein
MQAKLDEEAGQLVQLRQNIEQEWAGRALAGEARHQAQDVQRRITDDARARLPPASSGVGQNLAVAAILLRAMPEAIHYRGAAYLGRAQESPGGCHGPTGRELCLPKARVPPRSIAPRLPDSCGKPRSTPGARGTRRLRPRVASATSTAATTVEPASTKRCAEATTLGVGDAATVGRIRALARTTWSTSLQPGHTTGAVPDPVPSPNYHHQVLGGKQGRNCGLRTTGWPAS